MTQPKPIHFHSIDALRGFAALAVCLYHLTNGFLHPTNWLRIINEYGYLGVDAFFVISGFVVPYSFAQKNYTLVQFSSFFKKRFIRIEPAYWVSMAIIIVKDCLARLVEDYRFFEFPPWTIKSVLLHFIHANDIFHENWLVTPYWTLAIDWQFYIFIALIFFIVNRPEWWVRYPLYALIIASKWWFYTEASKPWLPYFGLIFLPGIIYFHYKRGYIKQWECYGLWLVSYYFIYLKMGPNHFWAILFSCALIEFFNKKYAITAFFGKISYSMYLTHIFAGWWFCVVAMHILQDEWFTTIVVVVGVVLSIYFAKLFYDKVEAPTQEWARKV
jgi:peptidoglycan/LPS O-acetylase OafA/YrhL